VGPSDGMEVVKSRPHRDSIPDRPDRSQSLYRMSYPAHIYIYIYKYIYTDTCTYIARDRQLPHMVLTFFKALCGGISRKALSRNTKTRLNWGKKVI